MSTSLNPEARPAPVPVTLRWTLVFLRTLLGGIFILAGAAKLRDPEFFAFTLRAFELGIPSGLVPTLAYGIPWLELLCGCLLVTGLVARPAALVIGAMMLAFIAGILSLQWRGLDVNCPCFGTLSFVCDGPLGACHLVRNAVFAVVALFVVSRGASDWRPGTRERS